MKQISLMILSILLVSACSSFNSNQSTDRSDIIPQAKPVAELLVALTNNDIEAMKTAFSEKSISSLEDDDWRTLQAEIKKDTIEPFGDDFDPHAFDYIYEGNESSGRVILVYKDGREASVLVTKENDKWKVR